LVIVGRSSHNSAAVWGWQPLAVRFSLRTGWHSLSGWGLLLLLTLTIHHGARASVFTGILMAPIFWLFNLRGMEFWIAIAGGLVIAYRFLIDWNRKYRELWLDREKQ
jgi:hypothetical protein